MAREKWLPLLGSSRYTFNSNAAMASQREELSSPGLKTLLAKKTAKSCLLVSYASQKGEGAW